MSTKPLEIADLDQIALLGCDNPNCDHQHEEGHPIFLKNVCHPETDGLIVTYAYGSGILTMVCPKCKDIVGEIRVHGSLPKPVKTPTGPSVTVEEFLGLVRSLSNSMWVRHWLHWNYPHRDHVHMAINAHDEHANEEIAALNLRQVPTEERFGHLFYVFQRINEDGSPYVSQL